MKYENVLLAPVLLALVANSAATAARGETYQAKRQSLAAIAPTLGVGQSADLANLAADLAKTTAKLAELQNARPSESQPNLNVLRQTAPYFSDTKTARQFDKEATSQTAVETTVRWTGSESSRGATRQNSMARPANGLVRPLRPLPTVKAVTVDSQILQAQGNEEIFYAAQALQEAPEEIAPESISAPPENSPNEGSGIVLDTCSGPTCDTGVCPLPRPRRRRIIVAGTEAVFLSPDINGYRSSFQFDDFTVPSTNVYAPGSSLAESAGLDDFYIAPRLWLGVQGERWGVIGRYFHLRAGENAYDSFIPAARDTNFLPITPVDQGFDITSVFEAYYTDLELTRNFCLNGSKNQFTFGVRYARIEHDESVIAMAEVSDGLINGGARSNRQASGTGITFGLNGRKPLFSNSCAHWFYNVRSSILWGSIDNSVETWSESILFDPNATAIAGSKDGAIASVNDDIFIGEVQLGLEWNFAMRCLPAKSFFRLAFEYQYWDASTGRAASNSFSGFGNPSATTQGTANADASGIRADLLGFSVGTGFTW